MCVSYILKAGKSSTTYSEMTDVYAFMQLKRTNLKLNKSVLTLQT